MDGDSGRVVSDCHRTTQMGQCVGNGGLDFRTLIVGPTWSTSSCCKQVRLGTQESGVRRQNQGTCGLSLQQALGRERQAHTHDAEETFNTVATDTKKCIAHAPLQVVEEMSGWVIGRLANALVEEKGTVDAQHALRGSGRVKHSVAKEQLRRGASSQEH